MAITVRSAASGTSTTNNVASIAITLPAGAATGDLVLVFGYELLTTTGTWSQSAGTGTFTFHSTDDSNTGSGGCQSFAAWRVFTGSETAPTFAWSGTASRAEWAAVALTPDASNTISIDAWATTVIDSTGANTHTPNSASAAGTGEVSVLGNCVVRTAHGTGAITWTDSSGWTIPTSGTSNQAGTASTAFSAYVDVATQGGVSGSVAPGVETAGSNFNVVANLYHVLVKQVSNAVFIPARPLVVGQALNAAAFF